VPTAAARGGQVAPAVKPYLDLYPLPNGRDLGNGIGQYSYPFTRATREHFLQGRIDMQLSARDLLFVRHTYDRSRQVFPTATGGIAATSFTQFWTDSTSGNQFFTAEENRTLSPSLLNSARFSTSVLTYQQQPANTLSQPLAFIQGAPFMGAIQVGGLSQLGNDFTTPSVDDITYLTWTDDLTYSKGKHLLKMGTLVEHAHSKKLAGVNSRGTYTFANLAQFLAGTPSRFVGVSPGSVLVRERSNTLFGFYVQDDYRITSN